MSDIDKRSLTERDICTKSITPALRDAGWDEMQQLREEVTFTNGRIVYYKPNIPIALIEARTTAGRK